MGSKKHKKHKSERRERYDDKLISLERPPSLKLILKVGSNSTPEHGSDSPAYGIQSQDAAGGSGLYGVDYAERHKKSKKKKKKKDREKKHKHHKEKRRHRDDSSQEDISISEDTTQYQEVIQRYTGISTISSLASVPVSKPMIPMKSPEPEVKLEPVDDESNTNSCSTPTQGPPSVSNKQMDSVKSNSSCESGREPRTCVLKLKQSKSPLIKLLEHLLKGLEKRDPHQFFAWPVTDDIAPGYSSIISNPMDFSTIRQKIEENSYATVAEFSDDFKLMCENAIKYNHVETVYHKAAKRLLHVGARLLQPENLFRSLRPLMTYMRELSSKELGFELPSSSSGSLENHESENTNMDSGDEGGASTEEGISSQNEEDDKRKLMRLENEPKGQFEPYVDDLTPDEILKQVQAASAEARNRLTRKQRYNKMGFLRQNRDGTTSMKILIDSANDTPERVISLGAFTGKLQQGTGQLQTFREDRRNVAKIVKPLNYGSFGAFAPVYDSRFSNLSKDETELVLNTYGDDNAVQYAESLVEFTQNSPYASAIANGLLNYLTQGEHSKTMATLVESQTQKNEQMEVEKTFPDVDEVSKKYENIKVDFDSLRTLSNLGLDVTFLDSFEQDIKLMEFQKKIKSQLDVNSSLIEQLHQVQYERLSQPLPQHLAHIAKPNLDEIQLAHQLTSNLTEMAKQLPPGTLTPAQSLRKAMGMSNMGLEMYQTQVIPPPTVPQQTAHRMQSLPHQNTGNTSNTNSSSTGANVGVVSGNNRQNDDVDTTPLPMDLEPEQLVHHNTNQTNVDIENELREFLESGNGGEVEHDTTSIEQMLLD